MTAAGRPSPRRALLWVIATLLMFLSVPGVAVADEPPAPVQAATTMDASALALMPSLTNTLARTVDGYRIRTDASDPRYYADGQWINGNDACWVCRTGPAVGAAALVPSRPDLLPTVIATMDRAIADHQGADGGFTSTDGPAGINTTWFVNNLGTVYLQLGDRVSSSTRARWATSIRAGVDYLLNNSETVWYVNGNINLSYTESLWLAWKITGEPRFRSAYEASWTFTLSPPQPRWAGSGLVIETTPSRGDGADGVGYLAENNGFDPDYAQLQLDVLASFYAVSGEPRALWLMNLLMNKILTRVDATYTLDARNGSRHSLQEPFMTAALGVLALSGDRPDLVGRLAGQMARVDSEYRGALGYTHINFYRGVGSWISTPLLFLGYTPSVPATNPTPPRTSPSTGTPATPTSKPKPSTPPAANRPSAAAPRLQAPRSLSARKGTARLVVTTDASHAIRSVGLVCGDVACGRGVGSARPRSADADVRLFDVVLDSRWVRAIRRSGERTAVIVVRYQDVGGPRSVRRQIRLLR